MLEEDLETTPEVEKTDFNQEDLFEDDDEFLSEEDSVENEEDSIEEEESEEVKAEVSRLTDELEKLKSRLHDTQQGFHSVCQERAALRKRIEELEAKEADEDQWFSSSEDEELEQAREKYAKSEQAEKDALEAANKVEQERGEKIAAIWESKAKSVRNSHQDYDEVVGWLNEEVVQNPRVKKMWDEVPNKTPSEAYALGSRLKSFFDGGYEKPVRKVSNRSALGAVNSSAFESKQKPSGARLEDFF